MILFKASCSDAHEAARIGKEFPGLPGRSAVSGPALASAALTAAEKPEQMLTSHVIPVQHVGPFYHDPVQT